ncbi:DNA ligase 1 [Fagus crenata]
MSASKARSTRKQRSESEFAVSDKRNRVEDEFDLDLSSDIKGIMSVLNQIREKAQKDGQKKNEETISSVASEIKSVMDELKSKFEKDRQSFAKTLSKSSKECENSLKNETARFQALYEKFSKEKVSHLQALKGKRERSMIAEQEKACGEKIAQLEESLKKKKQDDKTFSILRKTLGSFLGNASDEDFPPDD